MSIKYAPISPLVKRLKKITGAALYFFGSAFQTACKLNPAVKSEAGSWPDNFCFIMRVDPDGPWMPSVQAGFAASNNSAGIIPSVSKLLSDLRGIPERFLCGILLPFFWIIS